MIAASSARFMVCLLGCDLIIICVCGGLVSWVDYGCPQDRVACDKRTVRIYVFFWVPCRTIRADLGGIICVCLHGYRGVWVLVGLSAIEIGGVFEVKVKGYGLSVSAE